MLIVSQENLTKAQSRNLDKNIFTTEKTSIKQGVPVKKKTLMTTAFISALLFSLLAGTPLVNLGRANPYQERGFVSPDASTKPPKVTIFSPLNDSAYTENPIALSINVTLPESSTALGTILYYVIYQSDWQENETYLYVNKGYANSVESQIPGSQHQYFQDSQNLTDIPDGNHSIIITAVAGGWYPADNTGFYRFMINGSSSVSFVTDSLPPNISVLTVENKTYASSVIALNFSISEQSSQLMYSLDGNANVTLAGNTTLSGLQNGEHNITIFAQDKSGHIGASETIYFCVEVPFPTTLVVTVYGASTAVIGIGLLVYFTKRKH